MSSELTAATLTVTITEALAVVHSTSADNLDFAQTCTHTFANIANVDKRIFKLPNSNLNKLVSFGTTIADGVFVRADIRYIRVTNLDGSAALQVGLDDGASDAAYTSVAADSSIMYTGVKCEGANDGTTLDDATALKVKGVSGQQLEVLIASV
jgi:hypothetical protein